MLIINGTNKPHITVNFLIYHFIIRIQDDNNQAEHKMNQEIVKKSTIKRQLQSAWNVERLCNGFIKLTEQL